jgi:hypothetical protein
MLIHARPRDLAVRRRPVRVMGLPGIEPAPKMAMTCGNVELEYAKRRESTRNDLRIRERRLCGSGSCLTFEVRLLLYGSKTRFR